MKHEIRIPQLNTNDDKTRIVFWHVDDRERVSADQVIADIETTKAVASVEAGLDGWILRSAQLGEEVAVSAPLAWIFDSLDALDTEKSELDRKPSTYPLLERFSRAALLIVEKHGLQPNEVANQYCGLITSAQVKDFISRREAGEPLTPP